MLSVIAALILHSGGKDGILSGVADWWLMGLLMAVGWLRRMVTVKWIP